MPIPDKIIALFELLTPDQIRALPKAKRERMTTLLYHWAAIADPNGHKTLKEIVADAKSAVARSNGSLRTTGILADLRRGHRAE